PRQPIHRGTPGRRPVPVALVAEKRGKREFTEKRKTYCLFRPVHGPRGGTHRRTEGGTSAWSSGVAGDGRAGWRGEPEPHGWRAPSSSARSSRWTRPWPGAFTRRMAPTRSPPRTSSGSRPFSPTASVTTASRTWAFPPNGSGGSEKVRLVRLHRASRHVYSTT